MWSWLGLLFAALCDEVFNGIPTIHSARKRMRVTVELPTVQDRLCPRKCERFAYRQPGVSADVADRLCHLVRGCARKTKTPSAGFVPAEGVYVLRGRLYSQHCEVPPATDERLLLNRAEWRVPVGLCSFLPFTDHVLCETFARMQNLLAANPVLE